MGYRTGMDVTRAARRLDRLQQRLPWLAYPFAVVRKFGDDQAGNLAALLAYYSFVSLFPMLLTFVTVLDFILPGNPGLQDRLLHSALAEIPVIGEQLRFPGLHGSWWVLALSVGISLWGARGVANVAQYAFNTVWNVPYPQRPTWPAAALRNVGLLVTLGVTVLATGFLSGIGGYAFHGISLRLLAAAGSAAANIIAFAAAFRVVTAPAVPTRCLLPGALIAALLWQGLLDFGSLLIRHQVSHSQSLYGLFGLILGLLAWLHLQAQLTLLAVEADVVRTQHLWPRTAIPPPLTSADRKAYTRYVRTQQRRPAPEQTVGVQYEPDDEETPSADPNSDGPQSAG